MEHLRNILAGIGAVINPFGSAPQYRLPERGDRAKDMKKISGDFHAVGKRLSVKADRALEETRGKQVNHRAGA